MPVTIIQLANFRAGREISNGQEFADVQLPIMGGCQLCGASIAAYNACPSIFGYLRCANGCIGDSGFETVEDANLSLFPEEYVWNGVKKPSEETVLDSEE